MRSQRRTERTRAVAAGVPLLVALALALAPLPVQAQQSGQVTGLTVEQGHGFATLRWNPVEGATQYEIERTPVGEDGAPAGIGVIVGVWTPNRQVSRDLAAFADAGFNPGDRFQWRVRARQNLLGLVDVPSLPVELPTGAPWSDPVTGTTLPPWGDPDVEGQNLRTQWETTQGAQYTNDVNEYEYTAALDAASERVRVVEIGQTVLGRPINMFVLGYPRPLATAEEIASSPSALVNCNVHGNEPSSREACLILARELAFAEDERTIELLSSMTVLIVPSINGDGRAANTRGNSTGQDLNRDYSLIRQPETFAFVRMLRDYRPQAAFDGHEFGNSNAGDLPVLPPRHLNVAQSVFDESQNLIEGWLYEQGSDDGWWYCPYGCAGGGAVGLSQETILRNTMGLKNTIGSLLEARSSGGATRPNEGSTQNNRRRKTYSALYTYQQFLDYHRANQDAIAQAIEDAIAFQVANTGPIVFRGSRPIPAYPAPHPGDSPPPDEPATGTLDPPPCGYRLTDEQFHGARTDGPQGMRTTVAERIAAHGWSVESGAEGHLVRLAQPQRGLIPLLLDGEAAERLVSGERLYDC
jgi:hypothetical protein